MLKQSAFPYIAMGLVLNLFSAVAHADKIAVAVASNFIAPMKEITAEFESATDHQVRISAASSGKLYAQIQHGAPFDLFFSADTDKPQRLIQSGIAVQDSQFTYAQGTLVLWSNDRELLQNNGDALTNESYTKLAIANARLAPYGAAAVSVLEHLNLTKDTRSKWVQGENISQTYQFVRSGNAQLGFIALSQVIHTNLGSTWHIPKEWYPPIKQDAVLLSAAQNKPAATEFLTFIKSKTAKTIIKHHGYTLP